MSILGLLALLLGEGLGLGLGEVRGRGRGLNFGAAGAVSRGFTSSSAFVRLEWRIESMEKERGLEEGIGEGCGRGRRGKPCKGIG